MTDSGVASSKAHSTDTNARVQTVGAVSRAQTPQPTSAAPMEEDEKRVFKWDELVKEKLIPVDWLVDRLIPAQGVVVVGGDSGVGKSWLALHIAHCVATGKLVLGKFATSRGSVCFVDEENSTALLKRRVQKLAAGSQASEDTPVTFLVQHQVRIDRPDNLDRLVSLVAGEKPKLIIFDSFIRIHGSNENDSREMADVMDKMRDLQNRLRCAIVFTHHTRKMSTINAAGQMLRGSTDIRAFVDTHIFMRAVRAGGGRVLIEHDKSRYSEALDPFQVEIVDNETGTATFLRYLGLGQAAKKSKEEIAVELILELLAAEGPMTRQQLIECCKDKAGERAVGKALTQLCEQEGILEREVGARNRHTYRLAEGYETGPAKQPVSHH